MTRADTAQSPTEDRRGLGDFWGCIDKDNHATFLAFHERFHDYQVVGPVELAPPGCTEVESALRMVLHTDLVDAVAWVGTTDTGLLMVSHYPTVIKGCGEVDATILSTTSWEPQWEGVLEVSVMGKTFSVFDSMFASGRDGYRENELIRLSLCGLATSVQRMARVTEHMTGSSSAEDVLTKVYSTGVCWFGHSKDARHTRDFHVLFGKLIQVDSGLIGSLKIYRTTVELFPGVIAPIVFGESSIEEEGWTPTEGSFVVMMVFLHGYRTALGPTLAVAAPAASESLRDG